MFIPNNAQKLPIENFFRTSLGPQAIGVLRSRPIPNLRGLFHCTPIHKPKLHRSVFAGVACKAFLRYIFILCTPLIKVGPAQQVWYGLNLAGMVFVDLKKAFDTVDHQILCRKLESYGVLHRELAWFGSYLSSRVQYCRVNGVDSQIENIDIGLP